MKIYDSNGIQKISEEGGEDITVTQNNNSTPNFLVIQGTDGFGYFIGVTITNGEPVITLEVGSPLRFNNGVPQLQATDSLWYSLIVQTINGQPVLSLSDTGVS